MADQPGPDLFGPQLNLILENDRKQVHLAITGDGKLHAGIVMTAEQLDHTMAGLAQIRSRMLPEVPTELAPGLAREIKGTHYDFGIDQAAQELIFSLRDPVLGWLSLRFGAKLLERMLKIARSTGKVAPAVADGTKQ
jgi:hypothetical protein